MQIPKKSFHKILMKAFLSIDKISNNGYNVIIEIDCYICRNYLDTDYGS
jgi:hypothetical protein